MKRNDDFTLFFETLKIGTHHFDFEINNTFFADFGYEEFLEAFIKVHLEFVKNEKNLILHFRSIGTVKVPCDLTNELFDLKMKGTLKILVKFGEFYDDTDDEILILPYAQQKINLKQYIYEMIVLSVPQKRISPLFKNDSEPLILKDKKQKNKDPRWDELRKIITN